MPGKPSSCRLPLHIVFVFIDGVGLGERDAASNPFSLHSLPAFEMLGNGQQWTRLMHAVSEPLHVCRSIDAKLGVDGLPQSGTGQATLFTGVNCAQLAQRHFGPYPHSTSKPIIAGSNVFSQVAAALPKVKEPAAFANAYPPPFFRHAEARNRWTVTTLSCIGAGIPVRTERTLAAGQAITADLTGKGWAEKLKLPVDLLSEKEAAKRLLDISSAHAFTLFEYYLTDKAGHTQSIETSMQILASLDRFFAGLLEYIDADSTLLLITSDHGNIEDLSTKSHTLNPVPFIAFGKGAEQFKPVASLTDVTPAIVETLHKFNSTL